MDMRLSECIYYDHGCRVEILPSIFLGGVYFLRIRFSLHHGSPLLSCGNVYVALSCEQIWKQVVYCI